MGDRNQAYGNEPATLHKVMQEAIGSGLQKLYQPDKEVPHELLVIMMQINEADARDDEARKKALESGH